MKASRFTAEQIVAILHEAAAGGVVRELCRRHGITETTFYRWRRPVRRLPGQREPSASNPMLLPNAALTATLENRHA